VCSAIFGCPDGTFPNDKCWASFHTFILFIFFCKVQVYWSFLNFLKFSYCWGLRDLCILLSYMFFYLIRAFKIFSVSLCVLFFIFLTVSFAEQKFLILTKSNLSVFSYMDLAFHVLCKNLLLNLSLLEFFSIF
jgi:hypothetical protein